MVNGPEDEFDSNEFKADNCDSSVFRVQSSKSNARGTRDEARGDCAEPKNEAVMPPEFYKEVDSFLSREPPKLTKKTLSRAPSFKFSINGPLATYSDRGSKPPQAG
jgi:hypothetical protein